MPAFSAADVAGVRCWEGTEAPVRAQSVGQADGLRQRQPKSAAEDEDFANMQPIMACCGATE